MNKNISMIVFGVLAMGATTSNVLAGTIIAAADSNISSNNTFFNNVFSSQSVYGRYGTSDTWATSNWSASVSSVASSYSSGASLTATNLVGVDWFIAASGSLFSASELSVLSNFANSGGNIWVTGEGPSYTGILASGNQVLNSLGSLMSFSLLTASGTGTAEGAHPYLTGAPTWNYSYSGGVTGGTTLYRASNNQVSLVSYETIGVSEVPIPAAAFMFAPALLGFLGFRRKAKNTVA